MEDIKPSVTEAEFAVLVKRAALPLTQAQHGNLYGVFGHLEKMLALLRTPRDRGAEPSHVFVPGQGWE
jgi:hypothetical protein